MEITTARYINVNGSLLDLSAEDFAKIVLAYEPVWAIGTGKTQGSLFIALKGESFNGNAFAARALESGSAYAIVDEEAYAPEGDTRYIVVENSLKTLQQLANYHRRQMRTPCLLYTSATWHLQSVNSPKKYLQHQAHI